MQNAQQQLQLLEDAMSARKNIDVITEETNRLKQKLTERQETLNRLQKLCIAASSLLNSVDSSAEETEISSLQCLSKLDQSTAVSPTEPENEGDEFKLPVGKYLNQILAVLVDFSEQNQNNLNILSLIKLEQRLTQLFTFAEQKEIIPVTDANQSWKKGVAQHKEIFDRVQQLMSQDDEEPAEEGQ